MKYIKEYKEIDWKDWNEEEFDPRDVDTIRINNKFLHYCNANRWGISYMIGKTYKVEGIETKNYRKENGIKKMMDCYYFSSPYDGLFFIPLDAADPVSFK